MIGDGGSVSVAAKIIEHLLRSAKRLLRIDDPLLLARLLEQTSEGVRLSDAFKFTVQQKLARVIGLLQIVQEQAAIQTGQDTNRQKEARAATDPTRAARATALRPGSRNEGEDEARGSAPRCGARRRSRVLRQDAWGRRRFARESRTLHGTAGCKSPGRCGSASLASESGRVNTTW